MRVALGISYRGQAYLGWQSQPQGRTVQDHVEAALSRFAGETMRTVCAGRTDTGVHAIHQVVHLDTEIDREPFSWVRGTNTYLPMDIAVQWCAQVPVHFHARNSARSRRYAYVLLESAVRPAVEAGLVGWIFRPLELAAMQEAAQMLIGEHDFSAFRSSECQANTPIKTLYELSIERKGHYWRFEFEANAFLHHMVRNLMGVLLAIGTGAKPPNWAAEVLISRDRNCAAPTFAPQGLYFLGPRYDESFDLPRHVAALDWLP